ncbi:hypothetical protein FB451DRAFT_1552180 [Mycena latifolia]|nr:hypothetical protein FB451DRAFT_1552180 [Mycena latifolia]
MSAKSKPLVFVAGAAGFLSFEVVHLLEAGYPVPGAARGRKIPLLQKALEKYPQFKAIEIAYIATADYSAAFKGVGAVIHVAPPLPGRVDSETALNSAIEGSLRILREAEKAGMKNFVATGSMVAFPENAYSPNVTKEDAIGGNSFMVCRGTSFMLKPLSTRDYLEFADQHPEMDITITKLCPPWIFGPFAPGFEEIVLEPDFTAFSTNDFVYQLLRADIRVPIVSPYPANFRDAIKYISDVHPELRERLADPSKVPVWPSYKFDVDLAPKETILDAVDRFIDIENQRNSKGLTAEVTVPPM